MFIMFLLWLASGLCLQEKDHAQNRSENNTCKQVSTLTELLLTTLMWPNPLKPGGAHGTATLHFRNKRAAEIGCKSKRAPERIMDEHDRQFRRKNDLRGKATKLTLTGTMPNKIANGSLRKENSTKNTQSDPGRSKSGSQEGQDGQQSNRTSSAAARRAVVAKTEQKYDTEATLLISRYNT